MKRMKSGKKRKKNQKFIKDLLRKRAFSLNPKDGLRVRLISQL